VGPADLIDAGMATEEEEPRGPDVLVVLPELAIPRVRVIEILRREQQEVVSSPLARPLGQMNVLTFLVAGQSAPEGEPAGGRFPTAALNHEFGGVAGGGE